MAFTPLFTQLRHWCMMAEKVAHWAVAQRRGCAEAKSAKA